MTVKVPLPHRVGPTVPIPEVPVHMLLLNLIKETIREDPARIAFVTYLVSSGSLEVYSV